MKPNHSTFHCQYNQRQWRDFAGRSGRTPTIAEKMLCDCIFVHIDTSRKLYSFYYTVHCNRYLVLSIQCMYLLQTLLQS